jgi:hypothetical protein
MNRLLVMLVDDSRGMCIVAAITSTPLPIERCFYLTLAPAAAWS